MVCYPATMIGRPDCSDAADSLAVPASLALQLDAGALETLFELFDGDPEAMRNLVQTYLTSSQQLCDEMRSGSAINDMIVINRAAHTLKSSSAIFGASKLAQHCRELEAAAAREDRVTAVDMVTTTLSAYREARAAIAAIAGLPPER